MLHILPVELLSEIVAYLPTAKDVSHLALTCRTLKTFVDKDGWRIFVQSRFPSIPVAPQWRDAAHALSTLSRNWNRKAFLARYLEPSGSITVLPAGGRRLRWRWQRPRGQTMGFQPVIDSYEEWVGNGWSDRREVLAFSAGAELVVRVKNSGSVPRGIWERSSAADRETFFDSFHRKVDWICYKESHHAEGRDDITLVNVLRPSQREHWTGGYESVIVGRVSGELVMLEMQSSANTSPLVTTYVTSGRQVRSGDLSPAASPLLAACLSDTQLALYPVQPKARRVPPISEVNVLPNVRHGCRTWSTRFLSGERLAVGIGPSPEPVHVFQVTPHGLSKEPIRKFSTDGAIWAAYDRIAINGGPRFSSVYPIAAVPPSSVAGDEAGNVFLSGCYDGVVRLHDIRSPSSYEVSYWDTTDQSPVYSLQTIGRERIVAGAARHSLLKVFDLRLGGGRAYHYLGAAIPEPDIPSQTQSRAPESTDGTSYWPVRPQRSGWNVYLSPRNRAMGRPNSAREQRWSNRRSVDSPIYSISSPSPSSPSLYAGVENNLVQLDLVSMLDRHPDPFFETGVTRRGRDINVKATWNPNGDVLNLAMYEQSAKAALRLRIQTGVGVLSGGIPGYDDRWRDSSQV